MRNYQRSDYFWNTYSNTFRSKQQNQIFYEYKRYPSLKESLEDFVKISKEHFSKTKRRSEKKSVWVSNPKIHPPFLFDFNIFHLYTLNHIMHDHYIWSWNHKHGHFVYYILTLGFYFVLLEKLT